MGRNKIEVCGARSSRILPEVGNTAHIDRTPLSQNGMNITNTIKKTNKSCARIRSSIMLPGIHANSS
jgi:hypothetical protein